jgi:branched-chain amino acid transport system substrate-binding protein
MRSLTRAVAALVVAGLLLGTALLPAQGQGREIRIGLIGSRTGVFAAFGDPQVKGSILAFEEVNNTVAGRPIRLFIEDTTGSVDVMMTKVRAFHERDNVHAIVGPTLGGEGLAMVDWARTSGVPVVIAYSAPEDITMRRRAHNVVRAGWSGAQPMFPFGQYVARTLGFRRIVAVGQDYSFPWNQIGGFIRGFCMAGGREVLRVWHPVGTRDYSAIIATLPRDVDAVMYNGAGTDMVAFYRQFRDFGLLDKYQLLGASNAYEPITLQELGESAVGSLSAIQYAETLKTPQFLQFRDAYVKRWQDIPPTSAEHGYVGAKMVLRAIQAVGGRIEDREAFIRALRATKMPDAPRGPFYLDEYGNPVQNIYVRRVQRSGDRLVNVVIATFKEVSQFGPFDPESYMASPPDTRDYPPSDCAAVMARLPRLRTR